MPCKILIISNNWQHRVNTEKHFSLNFIFNLLRIFFGYKVINFPIWGNAHCKNLCLQDMSSTWKRRVICPLTPAKYFVTVLGKHYFDSWRTRIIKRPKSPNTRQMVPRQQKKIIFIGVYAAIAYKKNIIVIHNIIYSGNIHTHRKRSRYCVCWAFL